MFGHLGSATIIDDESGGWPVPAPYPKQRVAKPILKSSTIIMD